MDSLRSELDTLSDLSGQLVSVSGQQEASRLDQVVSDLTTEWQLTTDQCNVSLQQVDSALQQSADFNEQLTVCDHHRNSLLFHLQFFFINQLINQSIGNAYSSRTISR